MADPWESVDAGIRKATGKGLDEWVAVAKASGVEKHKAMVDHLKAEHGLGHGHANSVALRHFKSDASAQSSDDLDAAMFSKGREVLRPIHEKLVAIVTGQGSDVELAPKKGYVSARRSKQFAILQPSTKDRYDLGLNLKGVEPGGRLEASGSWNAMVTHRVRITEFAQVDDEVAGWIADAYARA